MLAYAKQVIVVPGYGMAVAQAQHSVRELADQLEKRGVEVKYAIHPVAGRMPGHMNVLLAEANVPYRALRHGRHQPRVPERTDVALVIGANDVTNPAARNVQVEPDLRHADPRRRQVAQRRRAQALDEARLRRHRQPALRDPTR
jgi:NAD(P) transhydrogenase subunit beta